MSLSKKDRDQVVSYLKNDYEYDFEAVYALSDISLIQDILPLNWRYLGDDIQKNIQLLWGQSIKYLPQFYQFLYEGTIDIFFGVHDSEVMMLYYVYPWKYIGGDEYIDGFIIAGSPSSIEAIRTTEKKVETLPKSLIETWKVHSFLETRYALCLTTPESKNILQFDSPVNIGVKKRKEDGAEYECLAIFDSMRELPWCLTRRRGAESWEDYFVMAEKKGTEIASYGEYNLDDLLVRIW